MPRLLKIVASFLATLAFFFSLASPILAADLLPALTAPEMNLEKYVIGEDAVYTDGSAGMMTTLINGVILMTMGAKDKEGNVVVRGATSHLSRFVATMYQSKPASSTQYLAYMGKKLNLVPQAYAQGAGASFISPVINLWTVVRNVIYVFYIVIFVILGFMIMFRAKLNPQTVVNISNSLPNIIISLILVTFSFAICGLIVDLGFLANQVIYNIFYPEFFVGAKNTWFADATPITLIGNLGLGSSLWDAFSGFLSILDGGGPVLILNLVIAMTIISTAFKIFFNLLTKYISIFLIAFLSPLAVFTAGIAGVSSATNFFKQLVSAVLVFPATYFMINLSIYFTEFSAHFAQTPDPTDGFQNITPFPINEFLDNAQSVAGPNETVMTTIAALIGLGVLMTAAQIPQVIDGALNVKPFGAGGGEQLGGAFRKIPIIGGLLG